MASHPDVGPGGHGHAELEPGGHSHPGAREYVIVAVILAVLTSIEVVIYYIDFVRPWLAHLLLVLSAFKFFLVGAFFMHLKFDNKLFSWLFVGGIILALSLAIALLALFHNLFL